MRPLGALEFLILSCCSPSGAASGTEKCGFDILKEIEPMYGKKPACGAVYVTLDRLTKKGFLSRSVSGPKPVRGGRRRTLYRRTEAGDAHIQATAAFYTLPVGTKSDLNR